MATTPGDVAASRAAQRTADALREHRRRACERLHLLHLLHTGRLSLRDALAQARASDVTGTLPVGRVIAALPGTDTARAADPGAGGLPGLPTDTGSRPRRVPHALPRPACQPGGVTAVGAHPDNGRGAGAASPCPHAGHCSAWTVAITPRTTPPV
ncbi:hypothetical protein [Streptomyces sp. NPDC127197]|uniref:hypothetical protein n=1 Tax=Streptomyces sp. NPDC127197 TaxID=3345388 RepID=UPI00363D1BC5